MKRQSNYKDGIDEGEIWTYTGGEIRKEIMELAVSNDCSKSFEEDLKNIIDKIENTVMLILSRFKINSLDDLDKIQEAKEITEKLAESLY